MHALHPPGTEGDRGEGHGPRRKDRADGEAVAVGSCRFVETIEAQPATQGAGDLRERPFRSRDRRGSSLLPRRRRPKGDVTYRPGDRLGPGHRGPEARTWRQTSILADRHRDRFPAAVGAEGVEGRPPDRRPLLRQLPRPARPVPTEEIDLLPAAPRVGPHAVVIVGEGHVAVGDFEALAQGGRFPDGHRAVAPSRVDRTRIDGEGVLARTQRDFSGVQFLGIVVRLLEENIEHSQLALPVYVNVECSRARIRHCRRGSLAGICPPGALKRVMSGLSSIMFPIAGRL